MCTHARVQAMAVLQRATQARAVQSTAMNAVSSRSHSVFMLNITGSHGPSGTKLTGSLVLVDLAGSERWVPAHLCTPCPPAASSSLFVCTNKFCAVCCFLARSSPTRPLHVFLCMLHMHNPTPHVQCLANACRLDRSKAEGARRTEACSINSRWVVVVPHQAWLGCCHILPR